MSSLGEAASKIGEKIVDILDVFDLSFFISGAVVMAALLQFFGPIDEALDEIDGAGVFGMVLGSYVLGLVCFAVGRPLRMGFTKRWRRVATEPAVFHEALVKQGLVGYPGDPLSRYFGHTVTQHADEGMTLYTRMWAHVRSFPELQASFSLLNRYWVLSASYDGIAIAALVWILPVLQPVLRDPGALSAVSAAGWTAAIAVVVFACWHRALEYKRYQIEELVATVAHWITLVGRPVLEARPDDAAASEP